MTSLSERVPQQMTMNRRRAWMAGVLTVALVVASYVTSRRESLVAKISVLTFVVSLQNRMEYDVIDTSNLNRSEGFKLLNLINIAGKLDFRRIARLPVTDEWLTPVEREILQDEPVRHNLDYVAAPEHSRLVLVSPGQNTKVTVGNNITVRVDLKDARNRHVHKGGHFVRVWMEQHHGGHSRALAADVTDMRNGSYVATLPMLWHESVDVRAAIVRSREFRRLMLSLTSKMKMTNQVVSAFVSGKTEQVTLCSFFPVVPGFPAVCNLTAANSGLPWYCGQPNKTGLTCDHWAWSGHTNFPRRYPLTEETGNFLPHRCGQGSKFTQLGLLPHLLTLNPVKEKVQTASAGGGCEPIHPRDSWTDQSPRGFWEDKDWHPLIGCPLPPLDANRTAKCLQHTGMVFLGDSNARQTLEHLESMLGCQLRPDPRWPDLARHVPHLSDCPDSNTSLAWYPHAYPFFSGTEKWSDVRAKLAPSAVLDKVPSSGKYVILIHLYIHFSPLHISIYALHVRDTARAVRDLLARNPEVTVFVRGPHALVCDGAFQQSGDFFTEQSMRVLKHEFMHLRDHVTFLNTWDMTVANVNSHVHPDHSVVTTLTRMMLARLCPDLT